MKSAVLVSVLALTVFAVLEESAAARTYLNCVSKKVVIIDPPKGTTSSAKRQSDLCRVNDERWHCDNNNRRRPMHSCNSSSAVGRVSNTDASGSFQSGRTDFGKLPAAAEPSSSDM